MKFYVSKLTYVSHIAVTDFKQKEETLKIEDLFLQNDSTISRIPDIQHT